MNKINHIPKVPSVGDKVTFYWHGKLYEGTIDKIRFGVKNIIDSNPLEK